MCGIFGVLGAQPVDRSAVIAARDSLAHRGPDGAGLWQSPDGRVALAHRRLAVIAPTEEGAQPMASTDHRFEITFNGEIYNYRALRAGLAAEGRRFRTASDTEVLIEACRRWGHEALDRLSGMFAFGLWDASRGRLLLARDRAGEKPLYYGFVGRDFVFASELKAIVAWPGFQRRVHPPAIVDFLTFGFVAEPRSIWEGCYKLPPAHWMEVELTIDGPRVVTEPRPYWDLEFAPERGNADWDEEIRATITRAADEMAVSDVPLGTFLSGGVDSSAVTAALSRSGHDVRSFTVGFQESRFDERPFAAQVAERYRTTHSADTVTTDDVAPVLEKLIWHYDEPFNDYSYLPTYYLCRSARKQITVALSGDGGDELFAGYRKYQRLAARAAAHRYVPRPLAPMAHRVSAALAPAGTLGRTRTVHQYLAEPRAALGDMLTLGFGARTLRPIARGALREGLEGYTAADTVARHLEHAPPERVGMVDAMRYLDLKLTLAGGILVKVDRASMAVSLEVRPVFLHRDVMALAGRIPAAALASRTTAKHALKQALRPWLPDEVLFRPKQGFALPLGEWLRQGLELSPRRSAVRRRQSPLAEWLDPQIVARLTREHADGTDHTPRLHSLLLLERWIEQWEAA